MKSPTIRIALALALLGALLIAGAAFKRPAKASAVPPASIPALAPAGDDAATGGVKAVGTFVSASQASLAFQAAGRVKEIKIKEGDPVHAGDVLASLDTSALDFQVAQAQAALDAAQSRLDQLKNPSATDVAAAQASVTSAEAVLAQLKTPTLNDLTVARADLDKAQAALQLAQSAYDRAGGASNPMIGMLPQSLALQQASDDYQKALAVFNARTNPSDSQLKQAQAAVDQARAALARLTTPGPNDLKGAQAQVAQAQAALDLAKQNIANARIAAPFDGTVLWIGPHIGESASPGVPAITFADLSHMQVQVGVDENTLAQLKMGQTATITADALPGKTLSGKVSKIGMLATTTAGIISMPVTLEVDTGSALIAPGLSATVEINIR
ncbi:MAG: HlyD family secretion protein [Acidobacteriota bacterium]